MFKGFEIQKHAEVMKEMGGSSGRKKETDFRKNKMYL